MHTLQTVRQGFLSSGFRLAIILCLSGSVYAQDRELIGKIIDQNNKILKGANIMLKGTPIGTVSNSSGEFKLISRHESITVLVALVGYKELEVPIYFKHNTYFLEITLIPLGRKYKKLKSSAHVTPSITKQ